MNTVLDLVDKLRDTGESHARCNVVEVMGRGAGDIALNTTIGAGATTAIVAEFETDADALLEKMKASRAIGKRNFVVILSEAMGSDFGPMLNKRINDEAQIDSRFVRIGHIVRGGNPTMADRLRASRMGVFAVEKLLEGKSDLVVCERKDKLITTDIHYALVLDHFYKGIAKPEDLADFSEEQIEAMKAHSAERRAHIEELYNIGNLISL
jgi:6-phosphofructokinase 1